MALMTFSDGPLGSGRLFPYAERQSAQYESITCSWVWRFVPTSAQNIELLPVQQFLSDNASDPTWFEL